MGIFRLDSTGSSSSAVDATVCIIGAGISGLVSSVRLARQLCGRVVVLESGITHNDPGTPELDRIDNSVGNYAGDLRSRGLGGTSVKWAGKLLPISAADTRTRPWLAAPAWPFDVSQLDRYLGDIEVMMGIDRASYEEDASAALDAQGLLPRGDPDFAIRWPKRPSAANHDLAHVLRRDIRTRRNLDVWLGATVTSFDFDTLSGRLLSVKAVNHQGQSLVVKADEFLIAAGTIESTRLMLIADRNSGGVITRDGDSLGRHFNDHLGLEVAVLKPRGWALTNRTLADRRPLGADRHLHLELRAEAQRTDRITSAYFDFDVRVPETSALTQTQLAVRALKDRQLRQLASATRNVLTDLPSLVHALRWRYLDKQKYWPSNASLGMKLWVEQLPHWRNRLSLTDNLDPLGQPVLKVEFHKTEDEERAFRCSLDRISTFWSRHFAAVCELDWTVNIDNPLIRLVDQAVVLAHPAGSTRMGTSAANSVVGAHLNVHRIKNLSVVSASVFPTSGSANPTLTIMQLAMRAADSITGRLRSGQRG